MTVNSILAGTYRGKTLESFHRGVACLCDPAGTVLYAHGNPEQVIYPRSSLKPFQAIALIENGGVEKFGFTKDEIALMCASHNGEEAHLRTAASILRKCGADEEELGCGSHPPLLWKDQEKLVLEGRKPSALHNNCSGKHAGFLALCKLMGWDTKDYLSPAHPAQQMVRQIVTEMLGMEEFDTDVAVDGCSAPIYSCTVRHLATGFARLSAPATLPEKRRNACSLVTSSMGSFPFMVAGTERYCTDLMAAIGDRVIGKTGAEGVFGLCFKNAGIGAAVKIDDGKMSAQYHVAQAIVNASGVATAEELETLQSYLATPIQNWNGITTGYTRAMIDIPGEIFQKS